MQGCSLQAPCLGPPDPIGWDGSGIDTAAADGQALARTQLRPLLSGTSQ